MNAKTTNQAPAPSKLSLMAVLGMSDATDTEYLRIRGMQYASLSHGTVARIVVHGVAGLAAAILLLDTISLPYIAAWIALLVGTQSNMARIDRTLMDADRRRLQTNEVHKQAMGSIVNALVWIMPVCAVHLFGDTTTQLKLWTVLAMLMTAKAVLVPAVPISSFILTVSITGAAASQFAYTGL